MDAFLQFLIDNGHLGMLISAVLAGSILPFSSEVVMAGLLAAGASPLGLLIWGTVGNTIGSLINYWVGTLGREEWITRWTRVTPRQLERGKSYVRRYGPWAGLLAWVPIIGSLITVALGYMRANLPLTIATMVIGKVARYWMLIYAASFVF